MGVPHLEELRNFLEKNKNNYYSKTYLRSFLKQNYVTIQQNLDYLINQEKVVIIIKKENKTFYAWKKSDVHEKLSTKKIKKT